MAQAVIDRGPPVDYGLRHEGGTIRPLLAAATVRFALAGFFDGIVLQQILKWHKMLSLVPGMEDLRLQMLWDGYFHAAMYLVAVVGLVAMWRARDRIGRDPRRTLWGPVLIGFGLWRSIDAVLSHWLLGTHRIKDDSPVPLLWNLDWLIAFGVLPALLGLSMTGKGRGLGTPIGALLAVLILLIGMMGA